MCTKNLPKQMIVLRNSYYVWHNQELFAKGLRGFTDFTAKTHHLWIKLSSKIRKPKQTAKMFRAGHNNCSAHAMSVNEACLAPSKLLKKNKCANIEPRLNSMI